MLGICNGIESIQGFLGGARWISQASTVCWETQNAPPGWPLIPVNTPQKKEPHCMHRRSFCTPPKDWLICPHRNHKALENDLSRERIPAPFASAKMQRIRLAAESRILQAFSPMIMRQFLFIVPHPERLPKEPENRRLTFWGHE